MNKLQQTTARMLEIERINMAYNKTTNFGQHPNGQEQEIALILEEWDGLKLLRIELKNS